MGTSVNVAIPTLVTAFGTEFALVQWVVLSFLLATGAFLPIVGRLADMIGKRSVFLAGFGVYTVGSLLCGLAPGIYALIGFRMVQGIGAAALTAIGLAIVTDVFPAHERGKAIGINGAVLSAGIVVGPTLGGALVDFANWRWVFLMGVPVGLAGIAMAMRFVPRYTRGARQPFDVPGSATLVGALVSLSLALTLGQDRGFTDTWILGLFASALVLLAAFLAIESRSRHPVLDLDHFRNRALTFGLGAGLLAFVSIMGTIFVMPFYLENILGFAPRNVGLLMSVAPITLVIVAPIAGRLADAVGERIVALVGMSIALVGFVLVGTLDEGTTALQFVLRFLPVAIGLGTFQTPNNSAIMGSVASGASGVAGGLLGLTRTLGQTIGIAVLGTVWAARVLARAGVEPGAEVTAASAAAQVGGLHDMLRVVQLLVVLGVALCVADLLRRRRDAAKADAATAA